MKFCSRCKGYNLKIYNETYLCYDCRNEDVFEKNQGDDINGKN